MNLFQRYLIVGLASASIPIALAGAPPALADCTNAGAATVCAQGTVRGGGPDARRPAGLPGLLRRPLVLQRRLGRRHRSQATTSGPSGATPAAVAAAVAAEASAAAEHTVKVPIVHSSKELHMFSRSAIGAGMIAGAMLFGTAATAAADPPNCTAADLAGVMSGVSAGTSSYLFTHPDVNAFFTGLKGKPRDQMTTEIQAYLDANPQVSDELRRSGRRRPTSGIAAKCRCPTCRWANVSKRRSALRARPDRLDPCAPHRSAGSPTWTACSSAKNTPYQAPRSSYSD